VPLFLLSVLNDLIYFFSAFFVPLSRSALRLSLLLRVGSRPATCRFACPQEALFRSFSVGSIGASSTRGVIAC